MSCRNGYRPIDGATRSRRWRYALATLLVCCALGPVRIAAQEPEFAAPASAPGAADDDNRQVASGANISRKLTEALSRRGDLTLRNSSLEGALYTISELFGVNIVTGTLEGTVNGVFRDAPLHEILDGILLANGYGYRPAGDSLIVSPLSEMGQVNPFFESATIAVRAASVKEILPSVEMLRSPQGRVQAIESARTIFVLDFPERVQIIKHVIESIDQATMQAARATGAIVPGAPSPLEVAYFRTQFITAKTAQSALEAVLSAEGRVAVLENEDRLVIVDRAANLEMARIVLERIDRPRPQVRITALIYDISVEDIEQLGINWNQSVLNRINAGGDPQQAFTIDSIMQVPFSEGATGGTLTFMNLSRHFDLTGVILALQNARDARLLADPFVVVSENEEALFQSVSEIPYQQLTETSGGGQIGTTAFKEAGITLRVRPKISADGTVEMEVAPEFSTLTGFTPGDNQPIIDRRTATTTLRVANRQLVVIGGLRQRVDVGDFKGVPYLKDWKYIGRLFRARDTTVRESELVVFIVPEIVGYAPPLNPREQLVADTIGCRLDGIPRAEGCPPLCGPPGCGMPVAQMPPPAGGRVPTGQTPTAIRRLPPTGNLVAHRLPPAGAPPTDVRRSGLRPAYSDRYRASGGLDKRQQRVIEREGPLETADRRGQSGRFLNRFFHR